MRGEVDRPDTFDWRGALLMSLFAGGLAFIICAMLFGWCIWEGLVMVHPILRKLLICFGAFALCFSCTFAAILQDAYWL